MPNVKRNVKRATVIDLINNGSSISVISSITGNAISSIYRLMQRMKKDGLITSNNIVTDKGKSYVKKYHSLSSDVKFTINNNDIRLHNVQLTVKILNKPRGYDYRNNNIISMKVRDYKNYDLNNSYKEQFTINNVMVRTNTDSIEIFPGEIYARTGTQATKRLISIVMDVISRIENLYKITLLKDNYLNIAISKQHYALVSNELARYYKKHHKDSTFSVFDDIDGKVRLRIDISRGPEFEAEHPSKSPADKESCQAYFKDIINKDHYLPSDTRAMIQDLAETSKNMLIRQEKSLKIEKDYAENIKLHLKVLGNIERSFKRFNSLLSQKRLDQWIKQD